MTKLQITAFKQMIDRGREYTRKTIENLENSAFYSKGKARALALAKGLANLSTGIVIDHVSQPDFDIHEVKNDMNEVIDELSLDNNPEGEKNTAVVINWLVTLVKNIMAKVNDHSGMIKFNTELNETKAEQTDLSQLQKKHEELEKECEEVKQRLLKGNIILSSPKLQHAESLLIPQQIHDRSSNTKRVESTVEMCCRLIKMKSGVDVPLSDIIACHSLGNRGTDTSFLIKFGNRKIGSAWDILAAGMLTGKNHQSKEYFTDANVYLNFQLTRKKSELSKLVRKAKSERKIIKYGTDQNGRITVRVNQTCPWIEVSSSAELENYIRSPPSRNQRGAHSTASPMQLRPRART